MKDYIWRKKMEDLIWRKKAEDFIFLNIGKITILFIIGLFSAIPIAGEAVCSAKVEGMGLDHDWTLLGGCRIELKNGVWIPLKNYAVLED